MADDTHAAAADEKYDEDRSKQPNQYANVPDVVKQFVTYFHHHIQDKNVFDILSMYENSWNKITEKYFKESEWPHPMDISYLVQDDPLFMVLYKELFFRHIYANLTPHLGHRIASWNNYCDFFNFLLNAPSPEAINLALPNQWIWDMVDEFIYQFQSFCQYRSKLVNKSQDELIVLRNNPQVWNTVNVLNILHSLISKSEILSVLEHEKAGTTDESSKGFGQHPIYRMIGYFSLVGVSHVQCILGNYTQTLRALGPIELGSKAPHTLVSTCHISLYYYVGFAYMMLRRYGDAIRTFQSIILYISRTKQHIKLSVDQVMKKNDQLYGLLSICLSLCPQRVDENIHTTLREPKYADKMLRMQRGDEKSSQAYEELFTYCCPKFIAAASPNFNALLQDPHSNQTTNYNQEALNVQTKLFLQEVGQQAQNPKIRSYLKLYTTIDTQKLAGFLEEKDAQSFRSQLLCFKHKSRSLQWQSGPLVTGELTFQSDVDFSIDKEMIVIQDSKPARQFNDFFLRNITKFEEIKNLAKTG